MATTQLTSGTISSYGTFTLPDTDWEVVPAHPSLLEGPFGHWYHDAGHFTRTIQHGAATVQVICIEAGYQWDATQWTRTSGSEDPDGYPAALGNPGSTKCAIASAREYRCIATVGGTTDTASAGAGHWMGTWSKGPMGCFPSPSGGMTISGTNVSVASVSWSIDIDPIPLTQVVTEETTPARTHATCVHQLRDQYAWAGTVTVDAGCGNASAQDDVAYSSYLLPTFSAAMTYGAGHQYGQLLYSQMCPDSSVCLAGWSYARMSESDGITWTLSDQYGGGLRASGSEVDLYDSDYAEDVLTYSFTPTSMTGAVTGRAAPSTCCVPQPLGGGATHAETIQASTSIGIDLVACDQQTALTSGAGLKATATHFIDQSMVWDDGGQKYVQDTTYSDPLELTVPGSYSMTFQRTSRYEDRQVPSSADDVIRVELTSASLGTLDLPLSDYVMTLHDRALDAIGIDTADWGDHDEHGGPYYGLLLIWVQSPLSVQWAQDDRGEAAPPSWWYDTVTTSPLTRQATIQAVASFGGGPSNPVRRDLAWHPTRRVAGWLGEIDPGIAEADLWKHIGDWQRLSATKHLLTDEVIGGPFDMTAGDVTCGEGDPVDHTAYGEMPWSEDVTDWRLYRWVRFIITSDAVAAWDLTVTVAYEWDDITDGYESATDDRRTSYQCLTHHGTAVYTVNVPGSAASANCDIDLIGANAPYLERVTSITLTGLPGGYDETVIEDVQLLAPTDDVWIENTDQRPVSHGGEERYTCGSEPEYLGLAQTPEEYGGWWAMGGHCVARGVRNPGRDVGIAPDWGMPFVVRRNTDCGALQDELMTWQAWHGQRVGTWGLEGLYGQIHNTATGYLGGTAMEDWVDGDGTPLGLATGTGWITHVPILLQFPVGSQDLLSAGRDQDGATDIPVIVRAGCLRPAQGLNWAHSGAGTAPDFGFKSILYGARIDVATSGTAPVGRAGNGLTYTLYEHPSTGADRLVTTAITDTDSRLRFAKGVNEFRHVEYGADAMSDPDWLNRYDYLSDVLAPGEVVGDLDFGQHHYQVIPTLGVVVVLPEGALARVSLTRPIGDGCVILAYQESGTLEVWARRSPDHGAHWMPDEYLADGVLPSATRRADGTAAVAYVFDGAAYVTIWNGTAWGGPQLILADADVVDHDADRFSCAHYVVAQDWTTGDLTCHVTWERGGSWTSIEVGTIAADADADTVPSIKQAADGSLRVAYIAGGSVVTKHSNDEGVNWV